MWLLWGLFFFSVLLTAGNSLKCEYCVSTTSICSGSKQGCTYNKTVCMTLIAEINATVKIPASMKRCSSLGDCEHYESLKGKLLSGQPLNVTDNLSGLLVGSVIKSVFCTKGNSKAPPHFASFFPAFLVLPLMKLLF